MRNVLDCISLPVGCGAMIELATTHVSRLDFATGSAAPGERALAQEAPVALEYNGLAYAVMMATPRDLADYAVGFTLAEGLVETADDVLSIDIAPLDRGTVVRITLSEPHAAPLRNRLRLRLVEGSCGLCGLESIGEVLRPLEPLAAAPRISPAGIDRALTALRDHQPAGRATGAMHAAAFCDEGGAILVAREDIGRHNALDKLTGHLARADIDPASGFVLLSARCSYELVEKTVRAGCPALVTISAASDLALNRAKAANLTLVSLARSDAALVMHDPHGRLG